MGFDWIFFVIVAIPVALAIAELARTWNIKASDVSTRR